MKYYTTEITTVDGQTAVATFERADKNAALVPGDVLLNDSCHVCIAVADYDLNGVT